MKIIDAKTKFLKEIKENLINKLIIFYNPKPTLKIILDIVDDDDFYMGIFPERYKMLLYNVASNEKEEKYIWTKEIKILLQTGKHRIDGYGSELL